jgi:hypothetical protein
MAARTWRQHQRQGLARSVLETLAPNLRRMGPDFAPEKLGTRRAEGPNKPIPARLQATGLNVVTATRLPASYPDGQGRMQ